MSLYVVMVLSRVRKNVMTVMQKVEMVAVLFAVVNLVTLVSSPAESLPAGATVEMV